MRVESMKAAEHDKVRSAIDHGEECPACGAPTVDGEGSEVHYTSCRYLLHLLQEGTGTDGMRFLTGPIPKGKRPARPAKWQKPT